MAAEGPITICFPKPLTQLACIESTTHQIEDPLPTDHIATPEQREAIADIAATGFDIIVHPDGAVELRR